MRAKCARRFPIRGFCGGVDFADDSFVQLDQEILAAPKSVLEGGAGTDAHEIFAQSALLDLDVSGACVTTMIVDTAHDKLYVANLGDCRTVAVWKKPDTSAWRCEVLSETGDHNVNNRTELDS